VPKLVLTSAVTRLARLARISHDHTIGMCVHMLVRGFGRWDNWFWLELPIQTWNVSRWNSVEKVQTSYFLTPTVGLLSVDLRIPCNYVVTGPHAWNSLPLFIIDSTLSSTVRKYFYNILNFFFHFHCHVVLADW